MANKTSLAAWLYSNRQALNPRFKEFSWPERFLSGLFDFSTVVTWNGIEAEGRGVDARRDIALEKSVAEAIERLICKNFGFDSVGFAAAATIDPMPHARFEALERFYLEKHIQTHTPFQKLTANCELAEKFRNQNSNSEVSFYRMATPDDIFGVVCSIESVPSQKRSLGFALSDSLDNCLRRSLLEALPNFAWLIEKDANIEIVEPTTPWHIDSNFLEKIVPLLEKKENYGEQIGAFQIPILKNVEVFHSLIIILKDAPLRTSRFVLQAQGEVQ
ncbi:MAG: hypothetical protein J0M15_10010 [Deltaproteobacteria bacterium]|nr:hypothetical protein [Deltaproteobacteria bacterium]